MKKIIAVIMILVSTNLMAQDSTVLKLDPTKKTLLVEASCGQCQFKMAGKGCTLAVRIKGKSYFVDKANIDAFGDAHGDDGFCNAISKNKSAGRNSEQKICCYLF